MFDIIWINYQTWLICGGRDFTDGAIFANAMGDLIRIRGQPSKIIEGGAKGADRMARTWAGHKAIVVETEKADWNKYGNAAGPIRNQAMLDKHKPDFVVAFPGGRGTADMIRRSREAGVDVAEIKAGD